MANEIEISLDTLNGPAVEYGPDDDAETVESEVPDGWRVDWETPAYKLASGRYRAPLVRLNSKGMENAIEIAKRTVCDYKSGDRLKGAASEELVEASDEETQRTGTGAVLAYRDDDGIWQHVPCDQEDFYRRTRGEDVVTVYVE